MRRGQRSAHGALSLAMTLAVAASLIAAFVLKQDRSAVPAPERLSGPEAASLGDAPTTAAPARLAGRATESAEAAR
ncbi:MAG: hypothetical protein AAGM38_12840 [Pseudomonadota bacterium]